VPSTEIASLSNLKPSGAPLYWRRVRQSALCVGNRHSTDHGGRSNIEPILQGGSEIAVAKRELGEDEDLADVLPEPSDAPWTTTPLGLGGLSWLSSGLSPILAVCIARSIGAEIGEFAGQAAAGDSVPPRSIQGAKTRQPPLPMTRAARLLSGWNNPLGILVANSRAREGSCLLHRAAAPRGPRSGRVTARRPAPRETHRR
jgi:hypothetical protein